MKKITMFSTHFAWLEENMLKALDCALEKENKVRSKEVTRSEWIKRECKLHLNLEIKSKKDLKYMDEVLSKLFYSNKAEWLRERIRKKVNVDLNVEVQDVRTK